MNTEIVQCEATGWYTGIVKASGKVVHRTEEYLDLCDASEEARAWVAKSTKPVRSTMLLSSFFWTKATGKLTADASTFGPCRDGAWWLDQSGNRPSISILSESTRRIENFILAKVAKSWDGELLYYQFAPVNEACPVKSVFIFND